MISSYIVIMTERASLSHESKTVATLAATEKTGCWLGRERPPRESLCLVAQMEAAGTFSPLHPLHGLIGTLKSKNSHEPDSSTHCLVRFPKPLATISRWVGEPDYTLPGMHSPIPMEAVV